MGRGAMADALAKEIISDWERQNGERSTFMWHWQQLTNYALPDRADYLIGYWAWLTSMALLGAVGLIGWWRWGGQPPSNAPQPTAGRMPASEHS